MYFKEETKVKREYYIQLMNLKQEKGLKNVTNFRKKGLWALKNLEPKLHVSFGNLKLPKTTCIVNLGTWLNCSGRKYGFCELCEVCYDKAPEVRFKERTKGRLEQEIFWRSTNKKTFAEALIQEISKHKKTNLIRWAEVGEIRNQNDLKLHLQIECIIEYL